MLSLLFGYLPAVVEFQPLDQTDLSAIDSVVNVVQSVFLAILSQTQTMLIGIAASSVPSLQRLTTKNVAQTR